MKNILYTHKSLWQDFDGSLPCEIEVVRTYQSEGARARDFFCSGRSTGANRPRIFASLYEVREGADLVVVLGARGAQADVAVYRPLLSRFNLLIVDYSGENGTSRHTYYPDEIAYANAAVSGETYMLAPESAKETPVYEWVAVARYALKAARELGYTDLALFGVGMGGSLALMTAALEPDVKCLVSCYGCGWERYRKNFKHGDNPEPEITEEFARYVAGCEAENYARSVSCPVLYLSTTNNRYYPIDRAVDPVSMLPDAVCSFAPRLAATFGVETAGNARPFLSRYLLGEDAPKPEMPAFKLDVVGGKVRCKLTVPAETYDRAVVYYAANQVNPAIRDWREVPVEDGVGILSVYEGEETLFVYPTVFYKNDYVLSGKMAVLSAANAQKLPFVPSQVLYTSAMGTDTFTSFIPAITTGIDEGSVTLKRGAYNIEGITDSNNRLATFKVNDARFRFHVDTLNFDLCTAEPGTVLVRAYENYNTDREVCYTAEVQALGGDMWQPVSLSVKQFKSDTAGLKTFSEVNILVFCSDRETLFNNILWV